MDRGVRVYGCRWIGCRGVGRGVGVGLWVGVLDPTGAGA